MLSGAAQPALLQSVATQPAWRALVADDNATNQLILGEMLELLGLSVQIASTGQQAVAHWQERAIDVLPRLPIVLVSGDATLRSLEEWRQHGIDHVLSKPIEFADLSRLIELMQQARQ